jgi:hypothetical protein
MFLFSTYSTPSRSLHVPCEDKPGPIPVPTLPPVPVRLPGFTSGLRAGPTYYCVTVPVPVQGPVDRISEQCETKSQNRAPNHRIEYCSRGHSSGFQNSARQNPDGGKFHSREVHWWSCASACTKAGNKEPGTPNYLSHRVVRSRPAFTGRLQTLFSQVDSRHRSIA